MKKSSRKGFTITELVIVIAVIAILAAVLIPTFASVIDNANESAALQKAKNAYTDYMANINYATEEPEANLVVSSGGYWFVVENGSMEATAYEEIPDKAETYTVMQIVGGTLEEVTVPTTSNPAA